MEYKSKKSKITKFDFNDLIQEYQIKDIENFAAYLTYIWKDLAKNNEKSNLGINKLTFSKYYLLPGMISDRLFTYFDKNKNGYIDQLSFVKGMIELFTSSFENLIKIVFKLYDFDSDGSINRDDIKAVLSHIPLNIKAISNIYNFKYENEEFQHRIQSQDEIFNYAKQIFGNKDTINENQYFQITQDVCSESFVYLIVFLLENKPFSFETLTECRIKPIKNEITELAKNLTPEVKVRHRELIAIPSLETSFSPKLIIRQSPSFIKFYKSRFNLKTYKEKKLEKIEILRKLNRLSTSKEVKKNFLFEEPVNTKTMTKIDNLHLGEAENYVDDKEDEELKLDRIQSGGQIKNKLTNLYNTDDLNSNSSSIKNIKPIMNHIYEKSVFNDDQYAELNLIKPNSIFFMTKVNSFSITPVVSVDKPNKQNKSKSHLKLSRKDNKDNEVIDIKKYQADSSYILDDLTLKIKVTECKNFNIDEMKNVYNVDSYMSTRKDKEYIEGIEHGFKPVSNESSFSKKESKLEQPHKEYKNINIQDKIIDQNSSSNIDISLKDKNNQFEISNIDSEYNNEVDKYDEDFNIDNITNKNNSNKIESTPILKTKTSIVIDIKKTPSENEFKPAYKHNRFTDPSMVSLHQKFSNKNFKFKGNLSSSGSGSISEKLLYVYSAKDSIVTRMEGWLYKLSKSENIKKRWFKLINRDFIYYKKESNNFCKGIHIICNTFLKENSIRSDLNKPMFSFSLIYSDKERIYYCEDKDEYLNWIKAINSITGYVDILDKYEIGNILGKGKYGEVKACIQKENGREAAIKIINKIKLKSHELHVIRSEIEILKICTHPHIIKLYDILENQDYIYIIMELCKGGDLFDYLKARKFKISEKVAANIIHQISTAIYYLHSYGIVHRDLKPENIIMDFDPDKNDPEFPTAKILDFGLSKMLGPGQKFVAYLGTIGYSPPEIILKKPSDYSVDLWSLGVITFLMLAGYLPFNSKNKNEVENLVLNKKLIYDKETWSKFTKEGNNFVHELLNKDSKYRIDIRQVLEHNWFKNFINKNNDIIEQRENSKYQSEKSGFRFYSLPNLDMFNKDFSKFNCDASKFGSNEDLDTKEKKEVSLTNEKKKEVVRLTSNKLISLIKISTIKSEAYIEHTLENEIVNNINKSDKNIN